MPDDDARNGSIALCLSGGGFRATLFHLGVVRALREYRASSPAAQMPVPPNPSPPDPPVDGGPDRSALADITEIYAVSGGSVLAAHMIANWNRYLGDDTRFTAVEEEILAFSRRNLRDRILRRWVLFRTFGRIAEILSRVPLIGWIVSPRPGVFSRTYWLRREYDRLLGGRLLGDTPTDAAVPACHILSTSFTTGELCSFSGDHFDIETGRSGLARTPCGHLRLSFAVAASSAFPPMFPPIELNDDLLANPDPPDHFEKICLSDGGVFDNLGVEKFLKNRARAQQRCDAPPSTLVICDAGGSFRAGASKTFGGFFSRNVRASDILMHRIGDHAKQAVANMNDVQDIPVRIGVTCKDPRLDPAVQQRLRLVRTDFDRFDPVLAALLVEHGERVAHAAMAKQKRPRLRPPAPTGTTIGVETADRLFRKASSRSFRSLVFGFEDWTLYPIALVVAALVAGSVWYVIDNRNQKTAIQEAESAERETARRYSKKLEARSEANERTFEQAVAAFRKNRIDDVGRILEAGLSRAGRQVEADTLNAERADAAVRESVAPEQPPAAASPTVAPSRRQPVFLHFAGLLTREQITDLNATLKAQGWRTQSSSGERTPNARTYNEVRFAGDNAVAARQLADAINDTALLDAQVVPKRVPIIGPDNLEVWISR